MTAVVVAAGVAVIVAEAAVVAVVATIHCFSYFVAAPGTN
jgi:hypothetical protein